MLLGMEFSEKTLYVLLSVGLVSIVISVIRTVVEFYRDPSSVPSGGLDNLVGSLLYIIMVVLCYLYSR